MEEGITFEHIREALKNCWISPEEQLILELPCGCKTTTKKIYLCEKHHKELISDSHIQHAAQYGTVSKVKI